MGEGYVSKFVRGAKLRLTLWIAIPGLLLIGLNWALNYFFELTPLMNLLALAGAWLMLVLFFAEIIGNLITKPTRYIAQAILHISPSEHLVAAPNIDELRFGHELASVLTRQVYDYTAIAQSSNKTTEGLPASLFDQLPIAVIGLDEADKVVLVNNKAKTISQTESVLDQAFKDILQLKTDEEHSIEDWVKDVRKNSLTSSKSWQKVEAKTLAGDPLGYFDISISFNKHSGSGVEVLMTLTDHSDAYDQEDAAVSFVALAVHELRNPVTILRGYIEAFEDELGQNTSPQIADDLRKMNASAENMATFVSNILNVARINQGQLFLQLHEDDWNIVLPKIVDSLRNRAAVYGKVIELRMEPGMPKVAIDRMTIGEVVTNLVDNAVKYSPDSATDSTIVSRPNSDGLIETTVADKGVGIPSSVMPHLFSKFRRNHRNQGQVGGTGLGLFLSKAIVTAHSGNIWVSSKEGEGSTFGFTLLPYGQLAKEQQVNNNENIVRSSHGWIKNHTMQRR